MAAPPKRTCLITNESSVPKALVDRCIVDCISREELIRLSDVWGMENVVEQSLENKVTLRADWDIMLRENCWTLVPIRSRLSDIVAKLLTCKKKGENRPWDQICPPKKLFYKFELLPLSLGTLSIIRLNEENAASPPNIFPPPYTNLPAFTLTCLHPYFAIVAAWDAFNRNKESLDTNRSNMTYSLLRTIMELWRELSDLPMEGAESKGDGSTAQGEQTIASEASVESAKKRKASDELDGPSTRSKVAKSSP
ncbi:hypothetical protein EVG20_g3853 [Dentipellis fragilis]|uniref:Uncharacterized protein n=1 Tax=Dentipellis fragilis TaxID=205917 RepID=A0A4Y9YZC8_9AGAM|nr:hypothetical protein EVG20_g3853 [Dentipellis fragilis]